MRREVKLLSKYVLRGKDVILDVGANKGLFTKYCMELIGNDLTYILFEPSKINHYHLMKIYEGQNNILIKNYALSDVSEKALLYSDLPGSGLGSLYDRDLNYLGINFESCEEVEKIRFDDFCKRYSIDVNRICIVKIDVEGHEYGVLLGMADHLKNIPVIQFEFGGCNIASKTYFSNFYNYFYNNDFVLYRVSPIGLIKIDAYKECMEKFLTTNYIALNKRWFDNG
ncbi:MAG TPA: FkbM family methyltransferase [Emticicia sp.]